MPAIAFDTLHYVKRLQKAGVPAEQAEAQADVLSEAMSLNLDKLATKEDIEGLRAATKADLRTEVVRLEGRFTLLQWMIGFNLALTTAILWKMFS